MAGLIDRLPFPFSLAASPKDTMPTQLTDQRQPLPPTLREQLIALGANPDTLDQINRQIDLQHEIELRRELSQSQEVSNDQEII
jgi:hypothetical protein